MKAVILWFFTPHKMLGLQTTMMLPRVHNERARNVRNCPFRSFAGRKNRGNCAQFGAPNAETEERLYELKKGTSPVSAPYEYRVVRKSLRALRTMHDDSWDTQYKVESI